MGIFKKRSQSGPHPYCAVVVPAAGSGTRMGGDVAKVMLELGGRPLIAHTLTALQECPVVDEIIVATSESLILPICDICQEYGVSKSKKIILGGDTRTKSVYNAILEITSKPKLIAIHDGARPLASPALIERVIRAGAKYGAAVPAVPPKDTVKQAEGGFVKHTMPRDTLALVQTPQVFDASIILAGLTKVIRDKQAITDDCAAVEQMGMRIALVDGEYTNIKVTTPEDLLTAQAFLGGLY